jgi:hypothetical protein
VVLREPVRSAFFHGLKEFFLKKRTDVMDPSISVTVISFQPTPSLPLFKTKLTEWLGFAACQAILRFSAKYSRE